MLENPTFCSIVESPWISEFLSTAEELLCIQIKSTVVAHFLSRIDHLDECKLNISKSSPPWSWALRRLWSKKKVNALDSTKRKFKILAKNWYFNSSHSPEQISPVLQWILKSAFLWPSVSPGSVNKNFNCGEVVWITSFVRKIIHRSSAYGREGIIAFECTSHSSNVKSLGLVCNQKVSTLYSDLTHELVLRTSN